MQNQHRVTLVLLLAACSPETVAVDDTAASTTSPEGETSTTDEDPTTTESESGNQSTGLIPPTDYPFDGPCDPFAQNCPEGEKCVPYASMGDGIWDAVKCVLILGDAEPGEACTYDGPTEGTDTCGADSLCWHVQELDDGICTPFCTGTVDDPVCADGSSCMIANEETINLCLLICDPLSPECPEGQSCLWSGTDYNCMLGFDDAQGDACDMFECPPGYLCVDGMVLPECDANSCCAKTCMVSALDPDPVCDWQGTECVPFYEPNQAPPGLEDLGVCILPQP